MLVTKASRQRNNVKLTMQGKVENTCPIDGFSVIEIITSSSNQKEHFSLCVWVFLIGSLHYGSRIR